MSVADYNAARHPLALTKAPDGHGTGIESANRAEIIDITEKERERGDQPLVMLTSMYQQAKNNLGRFDDYALVIRRLVSREGIETSTTLEIRSQVVRKALEDCLADYASLTLQSIPVLIKKPYEALFHYRQEIRDYAASDERTDDEKPHLKLLTSFMKTNLAASERSYEQLVPNNLITFELLWALFRVDDVILQKTDNYSQAYRVKSSKTVIDGGELTFEISAWNWGYNGTRFGPSPMKLRIEHFPGQRKITDLNVFPLNILPENVQQNYRDTFIGRGRNWKSLVDVTYGEYDGPMWVIPQGDKIESLEALIINQASGRIILDSGSFQQKNYTLATRLIGANGIIRPKAESQGSYYDDYYMRKALKKLIESESEFENGRTGSLSRETTYPNDENYQMTDDQALICPARVPGFALSSKKWAMFLVDEIREVMWRDDSFEKLELDERSKSAVKALVQTHTSTDADLAFDDFIKDKGKGLVLLLYGPPGCGKTLTAETVAELAHRPLYYIGAADLGTEADVAEKALKHVFDLAKTWNAILLLDEADVFLSKRTRDDMVRNAFVAVFLRLLEYYKGILFLTTNRLAEFDPAFESRIHLSIEYNPLTTAQRTRIWRNLLSSVPACQTWSPEDFQTIGAELELNGRSIKNLIKTSLSVARQNKTPLTVEHLRLIYQLNYNSSQKWAMNAELSKGIGDDKNENRKE